MEQQNTLKSQSYQTQVFSKSGVTSSSEVVHENHLNVLNDIYHQNEHNLESYLDRLQEKTREESKKGERGEGKTRKKKEFRYLVEGRRSLRSLKEHHLMVNRRRRDLRGRVHKESTRKGVDSRCRVRVTFLGKKRQNWRKKKMKWK
jgi:hypothetical protein